MAYYQWLNGTSVHSDDSTKVGLSTLPMSIPLPDFHMCSYPYLDGQLYDQGLLTPVSSPLSFTTIDITSDWQTGNRDFGGARSHHNTDREQLTKPLPPKRPRDQPSKGQSAMRPPSLAATHPSNYAAQISLSSMLPPSSLPNGKLKQSSSLPAKMFPEDLAPPFSLPAAEVPWRLYTDPMWQTSSDPHYWSINRTILRSDGNTEPGNVVSPTWMVGLPFGGMTEMAVCYPSEDGNVCADQKLTTS